MYFVYLLKSVKFKRFYIGSTGSVEKRFTSHNKGLVTSTKYYRPWLLIRTEQFSTLSEARKRELYLKSLKNPKYVEGLIKKHNDSSHGGPVV